MLFKQTSAFVQSILAPKAGGNTEEFGENARPQQGGNDRKQEGGTANFSARLAKTQDQSCAKLQRAKKQGTP